MRLKASIFMVGAILGAMLAQFVPYWVIALAGAGLASCVALIPSGSALGRQRVRRREG